MYICVSIYTSAARGGHVCVFAAAGATWTLVTAGAPWAARRYHTSVVDAAGAIYVLGGTNGGTAYFNDVWASTDGGARAGHMCAQISGYSSGTRGMRRGTVAGTVAGTLGVL